MEKYASIFILFLIISIIEGRRIPFIQSPYSVYSDLIKSSIDDFQFKDNSTQVLWYTQTLDHFNFQNSQKTYQQRYVLNDQYWDRPLSNSTQCNGPILVYTGGEGDILWFYQNTQFVTETLAQEMNGLVLFIEHRYYGKSMPFGAYSGETDNLQYLSVEQALADLAQLILYLQTQLNASHCPVLAFGGSYSGMVAAYFRMKYPNVVDGALAASAPILYLPGLVDPEQYNIIVTNDFRDTSEEGTCSSLILQSLEYIQNSPESDFDSLSETFSLCTPLETEDDLDNLVGWIESGLSYMSNTDYPYPSNFFEPLPGNPVNLSCSILTDYINQKGNSPQQLIEGLVEMIGIYFNYTGQSGSCYNTSNDVNPQLNANNFNYQTCTEMVFPFASNGIQDMFPASPYNYSAIVEYCLETFGIAPDPEWTITYFGGANFQSSNIIFSNGQRDGWLAGGVIKSQVENNIYALVIEESPHHLDLRAPNPLDPPSVTKARSFETDILQQFSKEASLRKMIKHKNE
ncbi:peptidase S28 family protein [Tieghemostelium lacteum]|uniref:Peptidase S28 family protein n=1 Tax=Tieghemostelium lacteum TaxID=361077 RepID=A0A152A7J4_TIELA|nr:peptidase S28 family protein [Tieghemostelium lacteum]|eukprot:KYR02101.1 peptidase S28 family protein [Tieghemostelium lacteum]